ncbi:hypothetical protein B0T17DRAFT_227570 [Bombardia bombarda]|uniref:Uncharacterized protein n=1 Tax=Bombardia bombarda TaxID=252184 RepID=A0AA39XC16_9PEZI|nr:hypothetical protein B0T17DRAFT_227570 [Bombardia bombarda]
MAPFSPFVYFFLFLVHNSWLFCFLLVCFPFFSILVFLSFCPFLSPFTSRFSFLFFFPSFSFLSSMYLFLILPPLIPFTFYLLVFFCLSRY